MKRHIFILLIFTFIAGFSAAQTADVKNFRQEGIASWYGREFDGKPTASGEIYNSSLLTAAHPSLPFGTMLKVTNKNNSRQVIVRVNDRGPFVAARIVDLSRGAAEILDMIKTGTAPVLIEQTDEKTIAAAQAAPAPVSAAEIKQPVPEPSETIAQEQKAQGTNVTEPQAQESDNRELLVQEPKTQEPKVLEPPAREPPVLAPKPQEPKAKEPAASVSAPPIPAFFNAPPTRIIGNIPPSESTKLYRLQIGAYKIPRNATDAYEKLKKAGLNPAYEQSGEYYRVVLAGLRARDIRSIAQTLGNTGYREAIIREESR